MANDKCVQRVGDELLTCIICYEPFQSPKVLPCLHTFCQGCLQRHFDTYKLRHGGCLSCPSCRELIPPPQGGILKLKPDGVVSRTEELLKSLPGLEVINDEEDEDSSGSLLAGAAGINTHQLLASQKKCLGQHVTNMQTALSKLRSKILQLYTLENHVRFTIQAEVKTISEKMFKAGQSPSKECLSSMQEKVEANYLPTVARLVSEQDKMYQKIVAIKSVHDVTEEMLVKASPAQFDTCFEILMKHVHSVSVLVDQTAQDTSPHKSIDSVVKKYKLPATVMNDEFLQKSLDELNPAKRMKLADNLFTDNGVRVKLVAKIGARGSIPGKFDYPTNATFTPSGDFIVTDKNNGRLQVFSSTGELKQVLLQGLLKPRRAQVCPVDGYLYISDELSTSVKVVSFDGREIRRIGESIFQCPAGMAFDTKGHLVMTDPEKCSVFVFKRNGKLVTKFFFRFFNDKNIPNPYFVTVNEDDQIIVSDSRNGKIKIFSITGTLLFSINNLNVPRGLCLDPYGNILVAESDKHSIAMYSPYGKFLQYLVNEKEFGINYPLSLDLNEKGQLLVTQCGYYEEHQVLLFQLY